MDDLFVRLSHELHFISNRVRKNLMPKNDALYYNGEQ
jgi:hypothetical protein